MISIFLDFTDESKKLDILNAKKIKMFLTEDREECLMYYGDFIFKK